MIAGRWIVFLIVMTWRLVRRYPLAAIALVVLYLIGAGLVALSEVTGLGNGLYLLLAGAVGLAVLSASAWRMRPSARATRREEGQYRDEQQRKYRDRRALYLAWETGRIEPAEAMAQLQARNPTGSPDRYTSAEKLIVTEAEDALATGTTAKRDTRIAAYRKQWLTMGVTVSDAEYDEQHRQMANSFYTPEKFPGNQGPNWRSRTTSTGA